MSFCNCIERKASSLRARPRLGCQGGLHEEPYVELVVGDQVVETITVELCRGTSAFVALAECDCKMPSQREPIEDRGL